MNAKLFLFADGIEIDEKNVDINEGKTFSVCFLSAVWVKIRNLNILITQNQANS